MAGIFDEVMDSLAAKDKEAGKKEETKTTESTGTGNPMNTYHEQFKEKYGDRKNT